MAKPMSIDEFTKALKKWGLDFEGIQDTWAFHNRNHMGNWGPQVNGVMLHHTGSDSQTTMKNILWSGHGNLPGPLCHAGIDVNGKLWLASLGRANHAGLGDNEVLKHVINEDYTGNLRPSDASVDGNARFYGFEIMYPGNKPMSAAQKNAAILASCAILDFYDWTEKSVIGHGEWQPGKWDPGISAGRMMDMNEMRMRIRAQLKSGPPKKKPSPSKNPPKTSPKPSTSTYKVKNGDTLYSVAKEVLGDGNRWPEIVIANPSLIDMNVGDEIKLPKK